MKPSFPVRLLCANHNPHYPGPSWIDFGMSRYGRTRFCYSILILFSPLLVPLACAMWPLLLIAELCMRVCFRRNKEEIESERDDGRVVRCEVGHCGIQEEEEVGLMQRYLEDQLRLVRSVLDCGNNCHSSNPVLD